MTYQSTFSDMIARLHNGQNIRSLEVSIKYSKECINILKILQKEGYIRGYQILYSEKKSKVIVFLKYIQHKPVITSIKKEKKNTHISLMKIKDIMDKKLYGGLGIIIVSTSHGILSGNECLEKNTGGILLLKIL